MIEHGNPSHPASLSGLLQDEESQLLALSDAIDRANGPAICRAFDEVARACGLARVAALAGVSTASLRAALADPERPDISLLAKVVNALKRSEKWNSGTK